MSGISAVSARLRCPRPAASTAGENPNASAPAAAAQSRAANRRMSGNAHTGPAARPAMNATL